MSLQQITIPLENQAGRLPLVTRELAACGIRIVALSVVDSGHFGQVRLLVSDLEAARQLLMQRQIPARVETVLAVALENEQDSFGRLSALLKDNDLHIRYSYAASSQHIGQMAVVMALSDNDRGRRLMERHHIPLLTIEDLAGQGIRKAS
jgi:hypothetical protein